MLDGVVALSEQLDRREDEEGAEEVEHPAIGVDRCGADGDERAAHHQRHHDAEKQYLLLVLAGHRELAHDDHEHEEVVDGQRLLGDVAGEVLTAIGSAPLPPDEETEDDGDRNVDCRPHAGFAERRRVWNADVGEEVEDEEAEDHHTGDRPDGG